MSLRPKSPKSHHGVAVLVTLCYTKIDLFHMLNCAIRLYFSNTFSYKLHYQLTADSSYDSK